jgi:uncharacterized membrane protein YfcA
MDGLFNSVPKITLLYGASIIVVAYLVRGVTGFGSGLISTPLLLLLNLPITLVVPLVVALDYIASVSHGVKNRRSIAWLEIWPLLPFSFLGVAVAIVLFKNLDARVLRYGLAVLIIIYAIYSLTGKQPERIHPRTWAIPAGGLGGLIGTLFGTGGPFYVIYLRLRRLGKTAFRATLASIFLIDGGVRLLGYMLSGFVTTEFLSLLVMLSPVMLVSLYVGGRLHVGASQETLSRAICVLLGISGAVLLIR